MDLKYDLRYLWFDFVIFLIFGVYILVPEGAVHGAANLLLNIYSVLSVTILIMFVVCLWMILFNSEIRTIYNRSLKDEIRSNVYIVIFTLLSTTSTVIKIYLAYVLGFTWLSTSLTIVMFLVLFQILFSGYKRRY